ncbi:MAG: anaerobic glycerol-3-phosphate dehydrogenase subunit A [Bacteroidales bacterium]|nr:anaerobic glycerol-3-phosphate dehydrogenase subunit A [Candidatus Cryptobacteroides equifaecalis]
MQNKEFDVIIIGGGITGVGTARDCAMRGLKTVLVERFDLTNGATGRNHGLLHSGARYAVNDAESAEECIRENRIIRRIASNCVEESDGLFITLPEDDLAYQAAFIEKCQAAGIDAKAIDPKEALRLEPSVNPAIIGAVRVPDASVDPFRLASANALDATMHGAKIITYKEVTELILEGGRVVGVRLQDTRTGEKSEIRASIVVNAAGIWGQKIAAMAGAQIRMLPAKGSLLIFGHRVNNMVINRCRKPANADILVPGDVVCVIGTTSDKVPFEECDNMRVTPQEVALLLEEGAKLAPALATTRILRAYAGVRPLVASDDDPTGRSTSRGIVLLDHETRDGVPGFISITGGKLTSYRLMAEMATDLVCKKLGSDAKCRTAVEPLAGSEPEKNHAHSDQLAFKAAEGRQGTLVSKMDFSQKSEVLCECEHVTRAEIAYAVKYLGVTNMMDLRRRTRVGMGTCQGGFCMRKVAVALAEELGKPELAEEFVKQYLAERWKGMAPVCWGDSMREAEYMQKMYKK